jgi:hypothetical protein
VLVSAHDRIRTTRVAEIFLAQYATFHRSSATRAHRSEQPVHFAAVSSDFAKQNMTLTPGSEKKLNCSAHILLFGSPDWVSGRREDGRMGDEVRQFQEGEAARQGGPRVGAALVRSRT